MMKICQNCKAKLNSDDLFCSSCGAKYNPDSASNEKDSLFLKYSSYLNNDSLFNVAWAKEQGIVKSDVADEAEQIYKFLAMKGHLNSMFRYAMMLLNRGPSGLTEARTWLKIASEHGHVESINYLKAELGEDVKGSCVSHVLQSAPTVSPTVPSVSPAEPAVSPAQPAQSVRSGAVLSGEEVYSKLQRSAVEIHAYTANLKARSSGFLVSSTGFVVTNAHAVLDDDGEVYQNVQVYYGGKYYPARVVAVGSPADGKNDSVDLALLIAAGLTDGSAVDLGDEECRNGQKVYLIGNSLGDGICITSGIISDGKRAMPGLSYPYIMTDAAANHGNSGGPLVDERGSVIGVLVAGVQNAEGMNYAIPIDIVKEFLAYVVSLLNLPQNILGELYSASPSNMSIKDKIFKGIHLAIDVIEFILSIF